MQQPLHECVSCCLSGTIVSQNRRRRAHVSHLQHVTLRLQRATYETARMKQPLSYTASCAPLSSKLCKQFVRQTQNVCKTKRRTCVRQTCVMTTHAYMPPSYIYNTLCEEAVVLHSVACPLIWQTLVRIFNDTLYKEKPMKRDLSYTASRVVKYLETVCKTHARSA